MRILVISYFFPPYNTVGAIRVGKTARYLSEHGHIVQVVTAAEQSWKGLLPTTLPLEVPESHVIYSGHSFVRLLSSLVVRLFTGGESRSGHFGWFLFAYFDARRLMKLWKPDIIYASGLPFTAFLIAHWLSVQYQIPWVAELRDLWGEKPTYPTWRRKLEGYIERPTLRSASGLVTVSNPLAETLRGKYDTPIIVSYNGFDIRDSSSILESTEPCDKHLQIVYTGTIYKKWQDPSMLFLALQMLGSQAERISVSFYGQGLDHLNDLSKQFGVQSFVEVHEPVPYKECLRLQREADVLLLLQWSDPRQKGIYTGKLFEYIGACRPILSIGPTDNEPAELIAKGGFGVALNQPDDIAVQLRQWIIQKEQQGIPPVPIEATLPYSRDFQIKHVERFLQAIVSKD